MESTKKRQKIKPKKPYPEFPLYPHAAGRWAKKTKTRIHRFRPWDNPNRALEIHLEERNYLSMQLLTTSRLGLRLDNGGVRKSAVWENEHPCLIVSARLLADKY